MSGLKSEKVVALAPETSHGTMLDENDISFERTHFIADILSRDSILDSFYKIEFADFTTFFKIMKLNLIKSNKILKIKIENEEEFDMLSDLVVNTGLSNFYIIILLMDESLFLNLVKTKLPLISHIHLTIYLSEISFDQKDLMMDEKSRKWISKNPVYFDVVINKDNYVDMLSKIPYLYSSKMIRFFNINYDYQSFEDMPVCEFQKLEFWINHIKIWAAFSKDKKFEEIVINGVSQFHLSIFIDSDGNLFYNRQHCEHKGAPLFNILDEREQYSFHEMAEILRYTKLSPDIFYFPFRPKKIMWNMINYFDNITLMGNVNEIPVITALIMQWSWRI